jgi:hypothetical protein
MHAHDAQHVQEQLTSVNLVSWSLKTSTEYITECRTMQGTGRRPDLEFQMAREYIVSVQLYKGQCQGFIEPFKLARTSNGLQPWAQLIYDGL